MEAIGKTGNNLHDCHNIIIWVITMRSNFAVVIYNIINIFSKFKQTRISRKHEIEIMR